MRTAFAASLLFAFSFIAVSESPSAKQGRDLFEKRCTGCHALDSVKAGPPLRKVYLSHSASDPKFPYSDALKKTRINWDAAALDKWLLNPDAVAPGNDMSFRLENSVERAAIVAYLKELSGR